LERWTAYRVGERSLFNQQVPGNGEEQVAISGLTVAVPLDFAPDL